jgi:single-stranded-DNA-specific exonuclease
LLASRGITDPSDAERFLTPRLSDLADPFLLPQMDAAVQRIWRAIEGGASIAVYGDYDVDGITSTALMVQVLESLGAEVKSFLPLRMDEGYGLTPEGLQRCLESLKPSLILTVDCGTGSVAAVEQAKAAGVDIVVTDHHAVARGEVAPALAVVNPKLGDERFHMLAGVGVAFKLCHALTKHGRSGAHRAAGDLDLRGHLDLVALGTITDIVPLVGENRILARHGLAQLNKTENRGLKTLIDVAGITQRIDTYEVGFRLGPRLNAAGRLGDALEALELLLTKDATRAMEVAQRLDASNRDRQAVEAAILQEVLREMDQQFDPGQHFGLVVGRKGWHTGVIGIVASRLVQRYNRPSIVIGFDEDGTGKGSCRSIDGFDLVGGLSQCAQHLVKFGGHTMAAGLEIERANLEPFQEAFNAAAAGALRGTDLRPVQAIDSWVGLGDVDDRLFETSSGCGPLATNTRRRSGRRRVCACSAGRASSGRSISRCCWLRAARNAKRLPSAWRNARCRRGCWTSRSPCARTATRAASR